MIPHRLTFSGFGPHDHVDINFADLGPTIALCAPFGTGKTFILEAMLFALYGRGAWYSDPYDAMTTNGTGKASLNFAFDVDGMRYVVVREFRITEKTKSHKAWLYKDLCAPGDESEAQPIAGPKSGDVNDKIAALTCTYEEAISTRFLAQNRFGDLVATPGVKDLAALRRAIVFGMMNLEHLDGLADKIKAEAGGYDKLARELEAQLAGEDDPTDAITNAERDLDQARVSKNRIERELIQGEQALADARAALDRAKSGTEIHTAAIERYEVAVARRDDLEASLKRSEQLIARLKETAGTIPALKAKIERINNLKEVRETLYKRASDFATRTEWVRRRDDLESKLAAKRSTIATLEAAPGCDPETIALALTVSTVLAEYKKAEMENQERENRMRRRATERQNLERSVAVLEREQLSLNEKLASAPALPDDCAECAIGKSFAEEIRLIPWKLSEAGKAIEGHRDDLKRLAEEDAAEAPPHDLNEIRERGQLARNAESAVASAKSIASKLEIARGELTVIEDSMLTVALSEPEDVADPSADLESVRTELDELAGTSEKLIQANRANEDLEAESINIGKIKDELERVKAAVEELAPQADSARKALADQETEIRRLREDLGQALLFRDFKLEQKDKSISSVASLEATLTNLRTRADETNARRARLESIRDRVEGLRDLQTCFGPRGVKQILVDSIAPQISDIADSLFDIATEGAMRLRIATQRATEKGTQECFDILVRDARGERAVPDGYSGGQLQLIRIIFRIAVALWVGKLYGRSPDWLILDEAFDALGSEGSDPLLRVIEHLRDQFPFMLVVTHDKAISSRFPGQIYLTPRYGGVNVETVSRKELAA